MYSSVYSESGQHAYYFITCESRSGTLRRAPSRHSNLSNLDLKGCYSTAQKKGNDNKADVSIPLGRALTDRDRQLMARFRYKLIRKCVAAPGATTHERPAHAAARPSSLHSQLRRIADRRALCQEEQLW